MSIEIAMKHIFFLFLFVSSILMTSGQAKFGSVSKTKPELTLLAEWPTLRGNNKRDGRIDATGQFTNGVTLSQSIDYATSEAYVELITGGGNAIVKYSKGEKNNASLLESISAEWQNEARAYLDFGDGKVTKVNPTQNIKYARLFEGDSGYYRIEAIDGYDVTGNVNNDVFIGVRVYKGNTDKLVFEK